MSKIVILKNQTYLSSKSIYHNLEGGGRVSLENALNHIYPIGSIFITTVNQDPSPYLGGKWESFGAGRVLVGFDSSQTEFNTILKTGGKKDHGITIGNLPVQTMIRVSAGPNSYGNNNWAGPTSGWGNYPKMNVPEYNNQSVIPLMNPYIVVYMFKRIS